ncbi:hypothetical protein [Endozoicomonas arenosclerae]|uniref:hypothetical protein n=1 Tax=Endozoicomonas arenosclerae TaxID=1633495 RepID=UPI00129476CB|nr:hypothetical protein [Endozoicomonas arenosclerae]
MMTSSCSMLDWFGSSQPEESRSRAFQPSDWTFFHQWQLEHSNPALQTLLPDQGNTLTGQCSFSYELLKRLEDEPKGLLVPVIKVSNDLTLSPDLENSARLYKVLRGTFPLGGVGDSLTFYQTLLSSVEHTCPENMTRDIDSCQFKKWMSYAGLGGDESIYDESRLKRWYKSHSSLNYLVMGSSDLFNSDALLNARYSSNSRVITKQSPAVRDESIRPYVGKVRFDWVIPGNKGSKPFNSLGSCTLSWKELEEKRRINGPGWLDTEKLAKVNKALLPYFIEFMDEATKAMPQQP